MGGMNTTAEKIRINVSIPPDFLPSLKWIINLLRRTDKPCSFNRRNSSQTASDRNCTHLAIGQHKILQYKYGAKVSLASHYILFETLLGKDIINCTTPYHI